jgi:hypothetical protein
MTVRLSALRPGRPLSPGRFLVLIYVKRLGRPQGHSAAGRIRSNEKSNNLIWIRNRDLPSCNIVPQSTTLPRDPQNRMKTLVRNDQHPTVISQNHETLTNLWK